MNERPIAENGLVSLLARRRVIWVVALLLSLVAVDQFSKMVVESRLMVWSHESDIGQFQGRRVQLLLFGQPNDNEGRLGQYVSLNLNYIRNRGAAWGMMDALPDHVRKPFFHVVTWLAAAALFYLYRRFGRASSLMAWGLGLVAAGAVGNYLDRVRLGYVIDWIDVHWNLFGWRYFFPNFNIADLVITAGVLILIWDSLVRDFFRRE